jgi:hypothetical protein
MKNKILSTVSRIFSGISGTIRRVFFVDSEFLGTLEFGPSNVIALHPYPGHYVIQLDTSSLAEGSALEIKIDALLRGYWINYATLTIENEQPSPAFIQEFTYLDGIRVSVRLIRGKPTNLYLKVRRL